MKNSIQMWQKRIPAVKKRQDTIQMSNMVTGADFGRELRRVIMIVINTRVEVMLTAAAA